MNLPELLTAQEVSDTLHIGRWTIIRMVKEGLLEPEMTNGRVLFKREGIYELKNDSSMDPIRLHCPCGGPCYCLNFALSAHDLAS